MFSSAFAQTAPAVAAAGNDIQSSLMSMLPLLLMFVVLYWNFEMLKVSTFKHFNISIKLVNTSRFQHFNVSTFNISTFFKI